jgi:hypothetical protein
MSSFRVPSDERETNDDTGCPIVNLCFKQLRSAAGRSRISSNDSAPRACIQCRIWRARYARSPKLATICSTSSSVRSRKSVPVGAGSADVWRLAFTASYSNRNVAVKAGRSLSSRALWLRTGRLRRLYAKISRAGKKKAISWAAVSGASEPCVAFCSTSIPKSLRIVPAAAFLGSVAPIS